MTQGQPFMKVTVKRLDDGLPLPSYARPGDAGLDLLSTIDVTLAPGERAAIPTGIALAIPEGWAGFVHARSGRALNEGLAVANAPGVVDSGYRGEIKVIAVNLDPVEKINIARGDKIAQLVVHRVERVELEEAAELPQTERSDGGFGSSGR
jgi:dUTP pyrophosphatase